MSTKILIITGASKGIGYATAAHFNENHWRIINISRTNNVIKGVVNIPIDLSQAPIEETLEQAFEKEIPKKAQICLVHNAAMHVNDPISNQDPILLSKALQVSIISTAILNRLLIPRMLASSSILYIGSTLSEKGVPNAASYTIIKHALVGMMRATCQDLAHSGIHTACICPGFTNTDMLREHLGQDPKLIEWAKQKVGANRLINPEEIAELIYFVAQNQVVNGSIIHANLGQLES